ncbi:hypothetical protein [Cohnella nanjingensis]|uniref:Uncharacterized protein n=1 Tax=Cohnella nanjingensis TaxID=1387779 RepID=A0A7X0RSD8_9BACL|nr:hypothetical protein [Cohnella nanjingensis]MBB6672666.1 hypothetical protein [Cohnella nanjingensis]
MAGNAPFGVVVILLIGIGGIWAGGRPGRLCVADRRWMRWMGAGLMAAAAGLLLFSIVQQLDAISHARGH